MCAITASDTYPPIITMYIIIGEGCVLTRWSPPHPPAPIAHQQFKHTSRWCLSFPQHSPTHITMQIIQGAVLSNNSYRQVQKHVHVCEITAHSRKMSFSKKWCVSALTKAYINSAEDGAWVTAGKCQQCVPRQRVVINSINQLIRRQWLCRFADQTLAITIFFNFNMHWK